MNIVDLNTPLSSRGDERLVDYRQHEFRIPLPICFCFRKKALTVFPGVAPLSPEEEDRIYGSGPWEHLDYEGDGRSAWAAKVDDELEKYEKLVERLIFDNRVCKVKICGTYLASRSCQPGKKFV
jgi:hypothetical protein